MDDIEQLIKSEYAARGGDSWKPKQTRAPKKTCPRGNDPVGDLPCHGVVVRGVRVRDAHTAPVEEFGHDGNHCRQGWARCRKRACRSCNSIRTTLTASVRRAESRNRTDDDIRAATPTKCCPTCGEVKPSSSFSIDRGEPDGLHAECRPCNSARSYRTKHPPPNRAASARRRARERSQPAEPYEELDILERDNGTCYLCGLPVLERGYDWEIEHLIAFADPSIPDSLKPGDVPWNVAVACEACNYSKGSRWAALGKFIALSLQYSRDLDRPEILAQTLAILAYLDIPAAAFVA